MVAKNENGKYVKARHAIRFSESKAQRRRRVRQERRLHNFTAGSGVRKPGSQNPKKVSRA